MGHALQLSDETYQAIAELAQARGTTPEALAEQLLRERLAEREAIARQNTEWSASLDEQLARVARGETLHFASTEEFFAALDETQTDADEGADE